jgi:hypothetical protein
MAALISSRLADTGSDSGKSISKGDGVSGGKEMMLKAAHYQPTA